MLELKIKRQSKVLPTIYLTVFFIILLAAGIAAFVLLGFISTAPKLNTDDLQLDFTSFVYGGDGQEIIRLHDEKDRVWIDLDSIPEHMKNAIVATEDQRFWKHGGVDLPRTVKAVFNYAAQGDTSFGGSSITQQLVKNLTQNNSVSVKRKVQEMWLAMRLERKLDKPKILELYLNTVFFGEGAYGVQTAAYSYFGKDITSLSLAECAAIAGITQSPETYNPFQNPDSNKSKQTTVLKKMRELRYITDEEYTAAAAELLAFTRESGFRTDNSYTYFIDQVLNDVLDDLQQDKGYTRAMASKLIYTGGLKIYATMDQQVQSAIDAVFTDEANFPDNDPNVRTNAAMIVLDPYTGEIKGMAGGRGTKTAMRTLNRATQSVRQPGSSIKPISVYAPAIDAAIITPDTVIPDSPVTIDNWSPRNWYAGYMGAVTVNKAVEQSINVVAVKVLQMLGIDRSFDFMKNNLGITTLVDKDMRDSLQYTDKLYNSLALGGLTDGVTVREMANAYQPFVNRGEYIASHTYSSVVAHDGTVLLDKKSTPKTHIAFREQTAHTMTKMLTGVVVRGTGSVAKLPNNMPAAGKTGTTSEDKDRWFVGYTPYYVGAVWFGYDQPQSMERLLRGKPNPAAVLWKKTMTIIHKDLPVKAFPDISWKQAGEQKGSLALTDRRIYEGEISDGKANGIGLMTYPNGDRYYGKFVNNGRHGKGTLFYANGNKYEGDFANDEITGSGTLVWTNGDHYSGGWLNGKFSGYGTFVWSSGDTYSGEWQNEKFNGYGTFSWAEGSKYEGEWLDGSFNGYGTFTSADGLRQTGQWKNGKKVSD